MKHILIVDEAINGIKALEKALNKHYDLYLVDVNMPLLDGYSFVRALRRLADITQAGANLYIIKPTRPDVRINNIRRLLGESGVCPLVAAIYF